MEVAIITSGYFPVPASKGGAVEALDECLIEKNEEYKRIKFEILSIYDEKAQELSRKYKNSNFTFIKASKLITTLDKFVYWIAKYILRKQKHMSYRYIFQRLYYINEVSKILKKNNYDKVIIENHSTLFMALKKRNNYQKYKGRYYYHLHNEVTNDYGCKEIIKNCRKVLGVSNYINGTLVEFLGEVDNKKLDVLKNCVNIDRFNKSTNDGKVEELRKKYGIKDDEKVVIFTGRLNEEKGIKELLLAFKKVRYEKVKLLIVGSYYYASGMVSSFESQLHILAQEMKDKIIFTGFIPYSEVSNIYGIGDIAAIPSMWNDPAPLTIIESMASGLPIITTYSGGIPEYANEQCAVFLKRDNNIVNNLAMAIDKLLSDETLMHQMSKAGRITASKLNLDNYYKNFIEKISEGENV